MYLIILDFRMGKCKIETIPDNVDSVWVEANYDIHSDTEWMMSKNIEMDLKL